MSELTGLTIPVIMRISLLIKTIQPDQSNAKQHALGWCFNKNSWKKAQANQSAVLVELETAVGEKGVACVVGGISGGRGGGDAVAFWRRT